MRYLLPFLVVALLLTGCNRPHTWRPFESLAAAMPVVEIATTMSSTTSTGVQHRSVPRASRAASVATRAAAVPASPVPGPRCPKPSTCPALRNCENGGSYGRGTSWPAFYGAYQFASGTWRSHTSAPWGSATAQQQDEAADRLFAEQGRRPWPKCGRFLA